MLIIPTTRFLKSRVIIPISVLRRKLVGGGGLDSINPAGDGELALTLQESGVGSNELLRL